MDRGLLPVEKPGLRERVARRAQPADRHPVPCLAAKPADDALGRRLRDVDPAADEDRVVAVHLLEVHVELEPRTRRTGDAVAAFARQHPGIELLARHPVRDPQRLERAGEAEHREVVEQDEDETARLRSLGRDLDDLPTHVHAYVLPTWARKQVCNAPSRAAPRPVVRMRQDRAKTGDGPGFARAGRSPITLA